MPASGITEQLPDEILLQVFDYLALTDLALFSGISRRWRAVVASHPTYFEHPKLESTSPSAVAFFVAQVTCRAKSWDVTVIVHEPFAVFETAVLPAISSRLDDAVVLTFSVHFSHAQAIFDMLRRPASSLLRLELYLKGEVAVSFPEDINLSPPGHGLQALILLDVEIPETMPPFHTVTHLIFGNRAPQFRTTLRALARAFPAARDIRLTNHILPSPLAASDWPEQWCFLQSLLLTISRHRVRRAVRILPLSRVVHLTTMHTDGAAILSSTAHLHGALDMCFQCLGPRRFIIHLTSRSNSLVRSFYEFMSRWSPPCILPHQLLRLEAVMSRIVTFSIPAALWITIVPRMIQCTSITDLTLVLSGPDWLSMISGDGEQPSISPFPSLGTLTLAGEPGGLSVSAEHVAQFMLERLLPQSPLEVRTQGVDWTGATHVPEAIASHFSHLGYIFAVSKTPSDISFEFIEHVCTGSTNKHEGIKSTGISR